jgi:hypothetical protein
MLIGTSRSALDKNQIKVVESDAFQKVRRVWMHLAKFGKFQILPELKNWYTNSRLTASRSFTLPSHSPKSHFTLV